MKIITLTQKDIEKHNIQNTASGMLIDELAFATGKYTPFDDCNYYDYKPNEPYMYDYEADLFEHTKTAQELSELAEKLDVGYTQQTSGKITLQAGAYMALNKPEQWQELLTAYTESLKDNRADGMSQQYNTAMQKTIDDYYEDSYDEWLKGDRSNEGAISIISRYFTENRNGTYDSKNNTYMFEIDDNTLQDYKDNGYTGAQTKMALLGIIKESSDSQSEKERADNAKRKEEREKTSAYKAERAEREAQERKEKLLSMKLN